MKILGGIYLSPMGTGVFRGFLCSLTDKAQNGQELNEQRMN